MQTDILVIGSGIAGLAFAIKASKFANVVIVTKGKINESSTEKAQGGLAGVFGNDDSYKLHINDTLRAGDGLCNRKSVELVVKNAPSQILWLKSQGVKFDKQLSNEAVHSAARIVHSGDITGERIEKVLIKQIKQNNKITYLENSLAIELIKQDKKCSGAVILNNKTITISAKAVVLATGGLGRVFKNTCNPAVATGDGFALAYDVGAELQDMEFVQFHPTGLYKTEFLISETLRGEGGHLRNKYGEIYMPKYHRDGELAPRDVVSKFTVDEMKKTKADYVELDVTHLGGSYLKKRFPKIYKKCLEQGIDLTKQSIPVTPTAHYSCGGVKINSKAETNVRGLYAIGETSCSGLHGADRLASNSLTDCLVFGDILAKNIKNKIKKIKKTKSIENNETNYKIIRKNKEMIKIKKLIQDLMWDKVGIIRDRKGLISALNGLDKIGDKVKRIIKKWINKDIIELRNMVIVSKLIARSALARKESRGTHFLTDFPVRDDKKWKKHSVVKGDTMRFFR
jgi:L-aspartate oxidase